MARPRGPGDPLSWFGSPSKHVENASKYLEDVTLHGETNELYFRFCLATPCNAWISLKGSLCMKWNDLYEWAYKDNYNNYQLDDDDDDEEPWYRPKAVIKSLHRVDDKVTIESVGDEREGEEYRYRRYKPCVLRGVLVDVGKSSHGKRDPVFVPHSFDNQPAVEHKGICLWLNMGKLHCDDGPAMLYPKKEFTAYACLGKLHRLDGPAVLYKDTAHWYRHGVLHRDGGQPAFMSPTRYLWYTNGTLSLGKCAETPKHIVYKNLKKDASERLWHSFTYAPK